MYLIIPVFFSSVTVTMSRRGVYSTGAAHSLTHSLTKHTTFGARTLSSSKASADTEHRSEEFEIEYVPTVGEDV